MRTVRLPGIDLSPAVLGMGCASLGSRYGVREGLRALEAAYDRGVTWFDIAPAYGAGEAEVILARFLKGKREHVQVCTKVGLAPPRQSTAKRLLLPVARPVVAKLKGVRGVVRKSGVTSNARLPLTVKLIEQSLKQSLTRLGTDRVDVYALHSPAPEEVMRDDVLRTLEQVISRGQARVIAVAGELPAALAGAASGRYGLIQLADDPATSPLQRVHLAASGPLATVSHSILGVGGARSLLADQLAAQPLLLAEACGLGFGDNCEAAAAGLLMARAFASNAGGVVLASMFGHGHLDANAVAAELPKAIAVKAEALVARCLATGDGVLTLPPSFA